MGLMGAVTDRVRALLKRKHSYRECFQEADGQTVTQSGAYVIRDLARFCGAYKGNAPMSVGKTIDPLAMAMAEGRRQVYLRILSQLSVSEQEIIKANEEAM